MADIYKINPKDALRVFCSDIVIYWEKTGTISKAYPTFIKIDGEWEEDNELNDAH